MSKPYMHEMKYQSQRRVHSHAGNDLAGCEDAALWDRFRHGNKAAFDLIYERYFQVLCSYGDKFCKDTQVVEDVVQELFIYLWTRKADLGKTVAIKYYLFLCLRRKLLRKLTQENRRNSILSSHENFCSFDLTLQKDPSTFLESEELLKNLAKALDKLTDRQKEAIYLKFYNNLSFQEVALVMGIEVRSSYNLISRSLEALKTNMRPKAVSPTLVKALLLNLLMII